MTLGKAILEALDAARDAAPMSAKAVLGLVWNDVHPRPTLAEVEAELRTLGGRSEIVSVNDTDGGVVHSITARGRARALS